MAELLPEPHTSNHYLNKVVAYFRENKATQYWLLAAITLLAAVLRFYKLGEWSFWIDEIFTINRAQIHFSDIPTIFQNLPSTLWMPISLIFTEGFLNGLGVSEWTARLGPALIGIASIPILFFAIQKLMGSNVALIFTLLLAISPWHLFWSQNARFYTSLMLLYTLAGFAFFYAIEQDRPIYILISYVLLYFALSERMIAIFLLPVILTYLAILWLFRYSYPPGFRKKNILLLIIPMLGIILFDALRFLLMDSSFLLDTFNDFIGQTSENPPRLAINIFFNVGLPIVSTGLLAGLYFLFQKSRIGLFVLLSSVLPVIMLLILNPIMFTKDRFVFMTLPFWFLLTSMAIDQLVIKIPIKGKLLAIGILAIFITDAAGTNILYYFVNNGDRRDWKTAFETIKQLSTDGDAYVAYWPEFGPYYLGKQIIPYEDITPDSVVKSGKRYWFVIDSETQLNNVKLYEWLQGHADLIGVLYLRIPEDDASLRIYKYEPVLYPAMK